MIRHLPKRLDRWKGAHARLWTLTDGMPKLTILLEGDDREGCLMIFCGSPERIEAPIHWSNSDISVEMDTGLFKVVDRGANVLISNCEVGLDERKTKPWEE